jgi:hypothetical protein
MDSPDQGHGSERVRKREDRPGSRKRTAHRRRVERRQFFRIVYPLTLVPKILNASFRVLNLSRQGILLMWDGGQERPPNLTLGGEARLQIHFHDGEILDLQLTITRCQSEFHCRRPVYGGTLEPTLSQARLSREEAYLLRRVPDFCRVAWYSDER